MEVLYIMLFGVGLVGVAAFGKRKKPNQSFTNPQFITEAVHRSVILRR
jgi:hypothetical protein